MPIEDKLLAEQVINEASDEIAAAITELFKELGIEKHAGFILFLWEMNTGTLRYISDLNAEKASELMKVHLERRAH